MAPGGLSVTRSAVGVCVI